jgi:hypothetical protein
MNNSSVFESDFLTNDSLVPTFVFGHESQTLKRPEISGIYDLHQTRPSYSGESQAKICGYVIPQI